MAEQDKHEEEYHYPEDEYVQSSSEPKAEFSGAEHHDSVTDHGAGGSGVLDKVSSLFRNRMVLIVLAAVVAFIVLRIVTSHHNAKTSTKVASNQPAATQPVNNQMPGQSNQLTTQLAQQAASQTATTTQIESEVNSLDSKVSNNANSISQIQQQLNSLQSSINSVADNRNTVNDAVAQLALQVKQLSAQLKQRKAAEKRSASPVARVAPVKYYLRAVVPGRAWIYGTNKRTASIQVGDRVKQYGQVLAINAQEGMVVTSSGKVIEFSPADR